MSYLSAAEVENHVHGTIVLEETVKLELTGVRVSNANEAIWYQIIRYYYSAWRQRHMCVNNMSRVIA